MDRGEIVTGVIDCIFDVLDIEEENISEDVRLIGDLGADSLDLLDLTFHLEQRFKIKLSVREMENGARAVLGDAPLEVDGVYSPQAITFFGKTMPEVPKEELHDDLTLQEFPLCFRVTTMVNIVENMLEAENE